MVIPTPFLVSVMWCWVFSPEDNNMNGVLSWRKLEPTDSCCYESYSIKSNMFHFGHMANSWLNKSGVLSSQFFLSCSYYKGSNGIKYRFLAPNKVLILDCSRNKDALIRKICFGKEETSSVTNSFNFKRWCGKGKEANPACIVEYRLYAVAMAKKGTAFSCALCGKWSVHEKADRVG